MQHENDAFCPFHHCSLIPAHSGKGFESPKKIGNHFSETHAGKDADAFGCALGSCGKTSGHDRWSFSGLANHLDQEHKTYYLCYELRNKLEGTESIFRPQHLYANDRDIWVDCKMCASQTGSPVNTTGPPSSISGTF